ncbi:molybdenum ABC transporter ATP-binding protein [Leucobacter sp. UCD-THU]|uniref:sulfate/molybdate ABC transporter ATP-binding protein n=1 Tax=Leucobacter sp. UCD-THU TaxID=1292023 RepID=UPI00037030C1|nr:ATP-binding cassette domain-containing protein [Leucobacter sp. UCD-THU]EYT52153.1 molybdenum ABC transporter ATP-binding protein [Leucobacter sp. UCD-THU]
MSGGSGRGIAGALRCRIEVARGDFRLDARFEVSPGEIVAVIGPNGAGKSTLLGAVAGTLPLSAGRVELGGRTLSRREPGSPTTLLPRSARRVGHLDQRARLFPHLDAAANIAFGPRSQRVPRTRAVRVAHDWLERVGLAGRGSAREDELSGGQQQRVAIARTLAADPGALLLDEPFAALDVSSAQDLRRLVADEIRRLGVPALLVTHDPVDLIALADRVLVLEGGRIAQSGAVAEVLSAPATGFAAEFAGRVLVAGVASAGGSLRLEGAPVDRIRGSGPLPRPGLTAVASFDPTAVRVSSHGRRAGEAPMPGDRGDSDGSSTVWAGTVSALSASRTGVRLAFAEWPEFVAEVPVSRALDPEIAPGSRVRLELRAADVTFAVPLPDG